MVGEHAASVIGHRAQEGARKVYKMIIDKRTSDQTSSIGSDDDTDAQLGFAPRDTLAPGDLAIEWRLQQVSVRGN